jgi:hypothetical protein
MTRDELHDKIKSLTFDYIIGDYVSTGWLDYSPENEINIRSLMKHIEGLMMDDKLKKFRRVIKIK